MLKRSLMSLTALAVVSSTLIAVSTAQAQAAEKILNLYSARHYATDEVLYSTFTKTTGIKINRVDADDAGIITRLKAEGAASPADLILLVDAARLTKADADGLFLPITSKKLDDSIPANLRSTATKDGVTWTGFSTRGRVIVYDKVKVKKEDVATYEQLADPVNKGKVCTRSGSHPYNLSLFSSMMEHLGDAKTETFLKGMVSNMARAPKGGDTDQINGVASGECAIALANTYYVARMMRSTKPEDIAAMAKVGIAFPNQATTGTHMNIAGGAVAKYAKNRDNAILFMEYLASPFAQDHFANGNNEWPTVKGVKIENTALTAMTGTESKGTFKSETIPLAAVAKNQVKVQQMLDRVGYK